ncbi:MAG: xylene monooxygenase [Candidatus Aenigmarchaeota archaeon]|nr:xylene monooxygenase [Candidatus Aenigmarchaeota archaeon]
MQTMISVLTRKKEETHDIKTFRFAGSMDFRPGQFVMLKVGEKSEAFSVCSSPTEKDYMDLTMKMTDSDYKRALDAAAIGDSFEIKGPYGVFLLDENRDAVMLAGGIGVTPFMSMIKYATAKKLPAKITLLYSSRTPEDIAFRKELEELQKENKNLRVIHTVTRAEGLQWSGRKGRIDENMIREFLKRQPVFYVCGPPAMVDGTVQILKDIDIEENRIKREKFTGY